MAYTTLDEMKKLIPLSMLINLSNDDAGATRVKQANIDEAINQADREIDSYVSCVKAVPLDPVPEVITNLSTKMAIWNLHLRKYFDNAQWSKVYDQCVEMLKAIALGKITIEPIDVSVQSGGGASTVSTEDRKFTSDFWKTY